MDNELGERARQFIRSLEQGLKAALTPGQFFEALGFRYFGPVDGHDVIHLVELLRELREMPHPKLLHIVTIKGKGYKLAEEDQLKWHAQSSAFDKITGKSLKALEP